MTTGTSDFVIGGIRICLGVYDDQNQMFQWISLISFPLNLLLVRSHQAEIKWVNHCKASYPRTQQHDQSVG